MIQGTRESKILGGSGCFVRFSYFTYVTCCRLALFETFIPCFRVLDCLRVVVDVFEVVVDGCRWLLIFFEVVVGGCRWF